MFKKRRKRLFAVTAVESGVQNAPSDTSQVQSANQVPRPDDPLSPVLLQARWISEDILPEEMPSIAGDLLGIGLDTPALRQLAGELNVGARADVASLVEESFREMGLPQPASGTWARLFVTRNIARQVVAGMKDPYAGAARIELLVWNWVPRTEIVSQILAACDEYDWDPGEQRYIPSIARDVDAFFRQLAALTDAQLSAEAARG